MNSVSYNEVYKWVKDTYWDWGEGLHTYFTCEMWDIDHVHNIFLGCFQIVFVKDDFMSYIHSFAWNN